MLKEQDFNPDIKWKKDVVEITFIERKHFSGIYRVTYQIIKKAPFKVLHKKNEKLLSFRSLRSKNCSTSHNDNNNSLSFAVSFN